MKNIQVRDIEHGTIPHNKQPKEVLKVKTSPSPSSSSPSSPSSPSPSSSPSLIMTLQDVGKGIKSGVVGTLNKPREFAQVIK